MDINTHLDRLKESFLWAAARGGRTEECESLLKMGANIDWVQRDQGQGQGDTPLLAAVRNGHHDVTRLLLASGADTKAVSKEGENVLHLCAMRGDEELLNLFPSADTKLKNAKNESPLDIAVRKGYGSLSKRLEGFGGGGGGGGGSTLQLPSLTTTTNGAAGAGTNSRRDSMRERQERNFAHELNNLLTLHSDQAQNELERSDLYSGSESRSESGSESGSESDSPLSPSKGPSEETKDEAIPHAMSIEAWHRSQQNEGDGSAGGSAGTTTTKTTAAAATAAKATKEQQIKDRMENAFYGESGVKDDTEVQLISEFTTMGVNQKIAHLTRSLDQARLERDKHVNQAAAIRQQSSKMASDLMAAESTCGRLRRERDDLRSKVKELTGMSNYKNKSLEEMEQIESYLKSSLESVGAAKEKLIKERMSTEEEKRMCVICQTSPKTVLLMPCRHMCLCQVCSRHNELVKCPLCREKITQKIDVYA
ncbi:hypothetical protein TrST_g4603 [Triparma strigata]|uniref:RING-type domain-containing protein n=1 Tax=Triparma strigata TaxID=1606541 RepID=A0A9W7DQD7_9STRA|nr:hypothetical protein TrST_g4603 [Triparma strigata]